MFSGPQKHFRPLTMFACHEAVGGGPIDPDTVELAFAVELVHNMSLVVDDILDESPERRGIATIHAKFGRLHALMASGYLVADAYAAVADDAFAIAALSELVRRLGSAECMQWRLRRQPLAVEDWRRIAGEDTGSMFEVCACSVGARTLTPLRAPTWACSTTAATTSATSGGGWRWAAAATRTSATASSRCPRRWPFATGDPRPVCVDDDDPARLTRLRGLPSAADEAEGARRIAAAARDEAVCFAPTPIR